MKLKIAKILKFEETAGYKCEHCGNGLKYVVTVELENGDTMRVGRDCAQKDFITTPNTRKMLRKTPAKYRADRIRELENTLRSLRKSLAEYDETVEMFGPDYVLLEKDVHKMQLEYVDRWESELKELRGLKL